MCAPRLLEAEYDRPQVRLAQPLRGEAFQHAAFVGPSSLVQRSALAGYDDDQPRSARLRMSEEAAQSLMGLGLGQAMQIKRRVDRGASAREFALEPPFDRREWRRGGLRRSGGGRLGGGRRRGRRPGGPGGIRRRRQGRAAPPRDERATSVQSAISSSLRRRKRCGRRGVSFKSRSLAAEAR